MAKARSKPFERLGNYVLFKKIDDDALGELWRVAPIVGNEIGPLLALRKLTGDKPALAAAVIAAKPLASAIEGSPIVRGQIYDVIDGEPVVAWEYGGGRSLRHIIDRAREGGHPPIPIDQALALAEKIAVALDYVSSVKVEGRRLLHGSLIPQFVWIYDDGDVRAAGQFINSGLLASLSDPDVAAEIGPYVAPEIRTGGSPTRATGVYSIGAILYLAVTGQAPPIASDGDITTAIGNAKLMHSEELIPADIRKILEVALADDPNARYTSAADLKQAIADVLAAGNYAPTTFNLAFYLHNLLRKEMEGEAVEREKESKVNPAAYIEEIEEEKTHPAVTPVTPVTPKPSAPPPQEPTPAPEPAPALAAEEPPEEESVEAPAFGASMTTESTGKSKAPIIAAILIAVAASAAGVWYMTVGRKSAPATPVAQTQQPAPVTETQPPPTEPELPVEEPIITEIPGVEGEETPVDEAEAAHRKAIEDEVNRRLQEEMRKLQAEYDSQIKKEQEASAATAAPPPPVEKPQPEKPAPQTAAVPDEPAPEEPAPAIATAETTETTAPATETVAEEVAPPPPPPAKPAVKVGDLVVSRELDSMPSIVRRVDPVYPPIAARRKISALVIVSALIDENGKVIDSKVLRGDTKNLGFDDASLKAIRKFTFKPATKDGKNVKTWYSVPFIFGKQQ